MAGAATGAAVGVAIAGVKCAMEHKKVTQDDLCVRTHNLAHAPQVVEALHRFQKVSHSSPEATRLYEALVRQCDELWGMQGARGGAQIKAHRITVSIEACAKQLSRQALRSNDMHLAPATSDVEELQGHVNSFLHNIMLSQ